MNAKKKIEYGKLFHTLYIYRYSYEKIEAVLRLNIIQHIGNHLTELTYSTSRSPGTNLMSVAER